MKKISTLDEFERFIGLIIGESGNFLMPLKNMEKKFDIFKVYDKMIELACDYFEVKFTLTNVPFFMKLDIVSIVILLIYGEEGIKSLLENIYSTPFNANSQFSNEMKKDYIACIAFANISCITNYYEWSYSLLNHIYENIDSIPTINYQEIMYDLMQLLKSLNLIIQKNLYGENDLNYVLGRLNSDVVRFNFAFMQSDDAKEQNTFVFKRLSIEYPEILKVYQQAVDLFKSLQIKISFLT